jgi:hypothetical protein
MRLHPPIPEIPDDNPYLNDLFVRKEFGDSLFSLFKATDEGIVLCVGAPWGEGKTTFARMWMADLRKRNVHCVYFDAYEHDYSDDPFISFCAEIISLSAEAFAKSDAIQALKEDFRSKARRLGGKLLCTGTRIGVKALTLGILKDSDIDALNSIRTDLADSSSSAASAAVDKAIEEHTSVKGSITEFRGRLAALAKAVRAAQGFPLVIVVDELDRCRPDFALSLIERIKHLFSTDDVSFLLLANAKQLQNYVRTVYGSDVDAPNYLHKFFTLYAELPRKRGDTHENDYSKYVRRLSDHYGIGRERDLDSFMPRLIQHYGFSLREMERCFAMLAMYYAQLPANRPSNDAIVGFLAVTHLRFPDVFAGLAAGNVSYDALAKATGIDRIARTDYLRFPAEWFLGVLKFLLLTEEQYKALGKDDAIHAHGQWFRRCDIERAHVIPFFCSELVRFSMCEAHDNPV